MQHKTTCLLVSDSRRSVLRKRHFHKRRSQDVIELASRTLTRKASQTYHAPKSKTKVDAFKAPSRNKILLMPMNNSPNGKPKKRMHINERIDMTRRGELQLGAFTYSESRISNSAQKIFWIAAFIFGARRCLKRHCSGKVSFQPWLRPFEPMQDRQN